MKTPIAAIAFFVALSSSAHAVGTFGGADPIEGGGGFNILILLFVLALFWWLAKKP